MYPTASSLLLPQASTIEGPCWFDSAIHIMPRIRACRFSAAMPSMSIMVWNASTAGAMGTVLKCSPVRRASSAASVLECSEE